MLLIFAFLTIVRHLHVHLIIRHLAVLGLGLDLGGGLLIVHLDIDFAQVILKYPVFVSVDVFSQNRVLDRHLVGLVLDLLQLELLLFNLVLKPMDLVRELLLLVHQVRDLHLDLPRLLPGAVC